MLSLRVVAGGSTIELLVALNHMTVANRTFAELLKIAGQIGCVGVEARNDLEGVLFDGIEPAEAGKLVRAKGLRLLTIAEVTSFNNWSDAKEQEVLNLLGIAKQAGAEAVTLIPRNDGQGLGNGERRANLRLALRELKPLLEGFGLIGLIEPLGFETCSLRYKSEAVEVVESIGGAKQFRMIHDTFHHYLAGETDLFPQHTGIVHISGVVDPRISARDMRDSHRILVDAKDRIGNIDQLCALYEAGYAGPVSFEAFAEKIHKLEHPGPELTRSKEFITTELALRAA